MYSAPDHWRNPANIIGDADSNARTNETEPINSPMYPKSTLDTLNEYIKKTDNPSPGLKFDAGKTDWTLIPWEAMEPVARILTFGAKKYGPYNWQHVEDAEHRYMAACMRHLVAYQRGEVKDSESGESHLAHAIANLLFLLFITRERVKSNG